MRIRFKYPGSATKKNEMSSEVVVKKNSGNLGHDAELNRNVYGPW
jgi:hypothetical protein